MPQEKQRRYRAKAQASRGKIRPLRHPATIRQTAQTGPSRNQNLDTSVSSLGAGKLGPEELSSSDHVLEGRLDLGVLAGLESTVGVDPQDVTLEDCEHLVNPVSYLLGGWYPGRVDVVHSRANPSTILHSLTEH